MSVAGIGDASPSAYAEIGKAAMMANLGDFRTPNDETVYTYETLSEVARAGNLLRSLCYGASYTAGWWHDLKTGEPLDAVKLTAEKLCLIHSEISEALEGHRKSSPDDKLKHRKMIEVELADAVIRIGDLAGALGLDLGGAIAEKLLYNASRPDHKKENRLKEGGKAI